MRNKKLRIFLLNFTAILIVCLFVILFYYNFQATYASTTSNLSSIMLKLADTTPSNARNLSVTITLIVLIVLMCISFVLILFWPKKKTTDSYIEISMKEKKESHQTEKKYRRKNKKVDLDNNYKS